MVKRARAKADLKAIGARIRELRGDVLQEDLAAYLGISQGQLSKIERGKLAPTVETLLRLSEMFGRSVDWILTGKGEKLVWYASYGSNLNRSRFMCYVKGGRPEGSTYRHKGCRDKRPPREDQPISIPHELYFARYVEAWRGAVAFIARSKKKNLDTLGRMYLITEEQFNDVVRQENRREPGDSGLTIDFSYLARHEQYFLESRNPSEPADRNNPKWYGRVLNLGTKCGWPIFTFTAEWSDDEIEKLVAESNPPSRTYLSKIAVGLAEAYQSLTVDAVVEYLAQKRGIVGKLSSTQVREWIAQVKEARNTTP